MCQVITQCRRFWELRIRGSDSLKRYWSQMKLRQRFVLSLQRPQTQQNTETKILWHCSPLGMWGLYSQTAPSSQKKETDRNTLFFGGVWALRHFICEFHVLGSGKADEQNSPRRLSYSKINETREQSLGFKAPEKRALEVHHRGRIFACGFLTGSRGLRIKRAPESSMWRHSTELPPAVAFTSTRRWLFLRWKKCSGFVNLPATTGALFHTGFGVLLEHE